MPAYIVKNMQGEQVNIIEINPEQIQSWENLTGLTLEPMPKFEPVEYPDPTTMEKTLNELGVQTRWEE